MMEHSEVTQKIIGCAMNVHSALGPGFLESVYQNALRHELQKAGLEVECEKKIQVTYDGVTVGDFVADMLINAHVLIENKAVQALATAHEVQLVNYLTATGIDIGLLLNFGAARLEFKRKARVYRPKNSGQDERDFQDEKPESATSCPSCESC
jgi:GxxExxY protein